MCRRYTGTAAALGCLAAFLAACYSDPGIVTAANAAAHAALYPYDGLVGEAGRAAGRGCRELARDDERGARMRVRIPAVTLCNRID